MSFSFLLFSFLRTRKNVITVNLCVCLALAQILILVDSREDKDKVRPIKRLLSSALNYKNVTVPK